MEKVIVGIKVDGLEFDAFEYLIDYFIDECPVIIPSSIIETESFSSLNEYLISNGIDSELIFEKKDYVKGIIIDGFEFDDFDLTVAYVEDEYLYDEFLFVPVVEMKDFKLLNEFLVSQDINSKLITE